MSDLNALDQTNWYAPASLLSQLAFLIAGVWFARNVLRTMRAFQEQIGAILKLSITGVTGERPLPSASAKRSVAEESPYWLVPSEQTESAALPQPTENGPGRFAVARRRMILWLQAPMSTQTPPWRRIVTWLQTPAGS